MATECQRQIFELSQTANPAAVEALIRSTSGNAATMDIDWVGAGWAIDYIRQHSDKVNRWLCEGVDKGRGTNLAADFDEWQARMAAAQGRAA